MSAFSSPFLTSRLSVSFNLLKRFRRTRRRQKHSAIFPPLPHPTLLPPLWALEWKITTQREEEWRQKGRGMKWNYFRCLLFLSPQRKICPSLIRIEFVVVVYVPWQKSTQEGCLVSVDGSSKQSNAPKNSTVDVSFRIRTLFGRNYINWKKIYNHKKI